MDWKSSTLWWLASGILVAAELTSGTFYLLMLALGCAAGALAAHLGLAVPAQLVVAALVGGGATVAWHLQRRRQPRSAPSQSNPDVNIDIGQTLHVGQWTGEGQARVQYRGATWSVRFTGSGTPAPGEHVIVAMNGNELRVAPAQRP